MLDVPIWVAGQMVGVICHEHVGGSRLWTGDEERFGYLMSGLISIALERTSSAMAA
jgi:GAF domain-containing protein